MRHFERYKGGDISEQEWAAVAVRLECEPEVLKAISKVESGGRSAFWQLNGGTGGHVPAILYERHYFSRLTKGVYDDDHPDVSWPTGYQARKQLGKENKRMHDGKVGKGDVYADYATSYLRLIQAYRLDPIAALQSCSWGKFQIMGANFALCDIPNVEKFVDRMCTSDAEQIGLLAGFIQHKPRAWKNPKNKAAGKEISLLDAVKTKNWRAIAFNYNGPAYETYQYHTNSSKRMPITRRSAIRKPHEWIFHSLTASLLMCLPPLVHAEIKLSSDWITERTCTGSSRNTEELASLQRGLRPRPVCTQTEVEKVEEAAAKSAEGRSAAMSRVEPNRRDFEQHRGFKLQIDGRQHYLEPIGFMTKSRADEVCTPSNFKGQPTYRCNEGQRHAVDCHILIFNENFEEVGYHRIMVKEPYQFYCNGVPAVGVLNASDNLLLTTLQYFPIDRRHAGTVAEVGQGWSRMTVLLRLTRNEDGQVSIEQDDVCLGNPNRSRRSPRPTQAEEMRFKQELNSARRSVCAAAHGCAASQCQRGSSQNSRPQASAMFWMMFEVLHHVLCSAGVAKHAIGAESQDLA